MMMTTINGINSHRIWENSQLGPAGPEGLDALLGAVNRYILDEELGDPIPAGDWTLERTGQFLDFARDELRWKNSVVETPPYGGHHALWNEIRQEYPLVFGLTGAIA